jgi:hypothetical protein
MQVLLSEEEKAWIDKKPFHWTIKEGCPEHIRKSLQKKLATIANFKNKMLKNAI